MKQLALLGAAVLALAAGPALAQAGGGAPPSPGGSAGGAGASDRLEMPTREGANAQEAMDRQGELSPDFVKRDRRAEAYRAKLQGFASQSAGRRSQALSLREDAVAGKPIPYSSGQIRGELLQDMEDWRKEFRIPRREFEDLRDEIVVAESELTPAQWADRRAQWFELRDQWIAAQMASTGG